tara:strand:- start:2139 stop:2726 length:588 start_codon:yes stop_codon:yes gene_type:complete
MGKEQNNNYYDEIYKRGGRKKQYFQTAENIKHYYPTWKYAYEYLIDNNIKNVWDLGCGPGHFSSLFSETDDIIYTGYDFSEVAIKQAKDRNKNNSNITFKTQNLIEIDLPKSDTFYTSFEFFEHISFDLEIIKKINKGNQILFSVPNYDDPGHVRHFKSYSEIEERYSHLLELNLIHEISTHEINKIYLCYGIRK